MTRQDGSARLPPWRHVALGSRISPRTGPLPHPPPLSSSASTSRRAAAKREPTWSPVRPLRHILGPTLDSAQRIAILHSDARDEGFTCFTRVYTPATDSNTFGLIAFSHIWQVLAASQTPGERGSDWFQGTADAVRQYLWLFDVRSPTLAPDAKNKTVEDVVILAGDHLYRMDYMDFVQKHKDTNADITLAVLPVDDRQAFCSRASDFGLLNIDSEGRVIAFAEKPKGADLKKMEVDTTVLGLSSEDARKQKYIASMGIYVFKKEILQKLLRWRYPTANDFGGEIIPASAKEYNVQAYLFPDYWEDIGTIRSFFEANLALTAQPPKFRFYDPSKPIFTSPRFLPPTKVERCKVKDSILSHGCFLRDCSVTHSIVGIRQRLDSGVVIKDTMLSGADYYEVDEERAALLAAGKVPVGVGENTQITEAIVDKNARIGKNVVLINKDNIVEADRSSEGFYIRSGIIIVLKNATILDNFVL
eukprot:SM000228S07392  [mRNA]  locus=s228:180539:185308:- [translate_table: standard]